MTALAVGLVLGAILAAAVASFRHRLPPVEPDHLNITERIAGPRPLRAPVRNAPRLIAGRGPARNRRHGR